MNRLIASMEREGIGPNENVYAEIGSTWWYVMRYPDQAAHVLGKLLKHVGEDNVLWGTDCLFYGSPQPLIQAMRTFQISEELRERHGYPKLTKEIKAKILGLNGAALYGVEPEHVDLRVHASRAGAAPSDPARNTMALGPRTRAGSRRSATTTVSSGLVPRTCSPDDFRGPQRQLAAVGPRPPRAAAPHRAASRSASVTSRPAPKPYVSPAWNESPAPYVSMIGPRSGAGSKRRRSPSDAPNRSPSAPSVQDDEVGRGVGQDLGS